MSLTFFFKDKNLKPENIRKGVKIGKVLGTLEGGGGSGNNQDITADSSTIEQTITFEEGYDGIGIFTLLPYTLQSKTVNSSTSSQTVTPDQGYDGLSSVTVNPYALESKTVNSSTSSQTVTPSQGYNGLYQVLVNPYVLDTKSLDPSTVSQTVNSSADGMSSVSVSAVTSSIDSNIQAGNIKDGVTILGVTGNMASGDWVADAKKNVVTVNNKADYSDKTVQITSNYGAQYLFYGVGGSNVFVLPKIGTALKNTGYTSMFEGCTYYSFALDPSTNTQRYTIPVTANSSTANDGYNAFYRMFANSRIYCTTGEIYFPNVTVANYGMFREFMYDTNKGGSGIKVYMPNLKEVGTSAMYNFCNHPALSSVDFLPNIEKILESGMYGFWDLDSYSYQPENGFTGNLEFTNLHTIDNNGLARAFRRNNGLLSVSFPSLVNDPNEQHVWGSCFDSCFQNCTSLTSVSFPELLMINGNNQFTSCFSGCTSLTSVSFPKLVSICRGSNYYNAMSNCFKYCSSLTSISFPELTYIGGSNGMFSCFAYCTGLTSISFPKLQTVIDGCFNYTFQNCTSLTSVSFPEWTTASGTSTVAYMFQNCSNLTTFSAPKLSSFTTMATTMFGGNNTTLTTVTLHPGCLKSNTYGPIALCTGITSLTLSEDATDDVNIVWQPNLSFSSVADVLGHLDLNTSGKTCSFYSSGLTVTDDAQGSLQALYDAAVNAGWTISNLTITPYTP